MELLKNEELWVAFNIFWLCMIGEGENANLIVMSLHTKWKKHYFPSHTPFKIFLNDLKWIVCMLLQTCFLFWLWNTKRVIVQNVFAALFHTIIGDWAWWAPKMTTNFTGWFFSYKLWLQRTYIVHIIFFLKWFYGPFLSFLEPDHSSPHSLSLYKKKWKGNDLLLNNSFCILQKKVSQKGL